MPFFLLPTSLQKRRVLHHTINDVMQSELNVPVILNAIQKAGNAFKTDFRTIPIPQTNDAFWQEMNRIDQQCLTILKEALTTHFPAIPWHEEEFSYDLQNQPLAIDEYWQCDTMDGAIQYLQHIDGWTINLVLIRQGQPYFAAIYDPMHDELFWAEQGKGAFLNGSPIKPSQKTDLQLMLAVFEYPQGSATQPVLNQKTGQAVTDLLTHVGVLRNYGPHALQLAYVGAGRIDLFYEEGFDTYNWLPGLLIAQEAGADVRTTDGRQWHWGEGSLLVTAPGVADQYLQAQSKTHERV